MADSFTNKYLERKRQLTGNSTVTKRTTVPSKSASSNNHAEGEAVSSSGQGRSSGTSGSSRSGSTDSFTSGYLRRKQELSRPSIAQIDPFDLPQFDSSILPDVSTPNKKASQTSPSRVQQVIQERNYSPLDRANDIIQGALRQWAGGIGSAVGNVLDRTTSRYNSDAADQWLDLVQDSMENRDDENYFERPEVQDRLENIRETREQTAPFIQEIYDIAEETGRQGTEQVEQAKEDLGPVGSFAVDVGTQVPQMLADAAFGAVTGGSALLPLGVRSYGYGVQEAMENGADRDQAAMYGVASGAKEALTEKLFSVALPFSRIYGGGSFDDAIQRGIQTAVERFASTPTGQRIVGGGLSLGASTLTEGAEEFISDWLGWQMPRIYGGDVATAEETLSDSLYDFLVGAAVGGLGGVVSPETYNYRLPTGQENAGRVVNPDTTTAVGAPEAQAYGQNIPQNDNLPEATRQAVDLLVSGQEITGGQAERIARSPEAVALLGQLTGTEINTDAPLSRVKADIRAVAGTRAASGTVSGQGQKTAQTSQGTAPMVPQAERTAAQRVHDVNRVRGAASSMGMGESGQRAISAAYDGSMDADRYYAGFTAYYEAGLSGRAQDQVRSDYAADLTEAQRFAAYAAGQNDAAASLQREQAGVNYTTVYGDEAGFVPSEHSANLSQETTRFYNVLAKATGTKITVTAATGESGANGWYRDGTIYISSDAQNAGEVVAMHEITHRLQEIAPEAYRKYRDYAVNALSELEGSSNALVERYKTLYSNSGINLTTEEAMDEAAANFAGELIRDPERFERLAREDRGVARRLLDAVKDLIRKIRRAIHGPSAEDVAVMNELGLDLDTLEQAARLWEDALRAGRETTLQAGARDGRMGTTRNSLKEDGDHGRTREETRGAFLRRAAGAGYAVYEGETAAYGFRRAGQPHDGGNHGEITQEAQDTQRELTALGVSADIVDGPILRNRNGVTEERAVTQAVTVDRSHIFISKDTTLSPRNIAGHEAFHLWKSGTGRDSYIEILEDNLLFSSEAFREYQTPIAEAYLGGEADLANDAQMDKMREEIFAYISGDIHEGTNEALLRPMFRDFDAVRAAWEQLVEENSGKVRFSLKSTDSQGRNLTAEQQEFFRDSVIRDDQGRLMVMYHGTRNGGFTVFDGGKDYFYFTNNRRYAYAFEGRKGNGQLYPATRADIEAGLISPQMYEVYLNVKNPFIAEQDVVEDALYWDRSLAQQLRDRGYDALMMEDMSQVIVLSPEQIKNVTNKTPTDDPDIRRSIRGGSDILRENAALQEENASLRERVEYWRGQTRRTTPGQVDRRAVDRAARELIRDFDSTLSAADISGDLLSLYNYMGTGLEGNDELTYTEARRRADDIARRVVESAQVTENGAYQEYRELREYLRTTPLAISQEDAADITDYSDFRRRNFGRLNLRSGDTNIDQVYQELSEMWPEFFDEARENNPVDQLLHISEVADQLYRTTTGNPFAGNLREAQAGVSNEILERFFDIPQVRATFADRAAQAVENERQRGRERVNRVREQRDARITQLREQNRERVQRAIQRERDTRERQLERMKNRYQARDAAGRERRTARELRARISRHVRDLSRRLLRPSDKQHIPEQLRTAVAAMLDAINLESVYTVDPETGRRQKGGEGDPTKRTEAFRQLRQAYSEITKDGADYTLVIDPDLMDNLDELAAMRNIPLAEMSIPQLTTVWDTVKAVEASVRTANKMLGQSRFQTISQVANGLKDDNILRQDRGDFKGILGRVDKLVNMDMLTPQSYFHRLGQTGDEMFRMLRTAQDRQIQIMHDAEQATRDIIGKTDINKLERETHTFQVDGGTVTLSTAQIMSLYELMKREQAQEHIFTGGIRPEMIPGQRGLRESRRSAPSHVTAENLAEMVGTLTDEQVEMADKLQQYMGGRLSELGNEASMEVYGYRKFTEPHYFPIQVDRNQTQRDISKEVQAQTIAGRGFTKSTAPRANNAVMVNSIFDVYAAHVNDMATYAAWLPTMENVRRIRDFTFRDSEGNRTGTVKDIIERVFGRNGNPYLNKLVDDLNQGVRSTADPGLMDRIVGNYKAASVSANLRVILQQPTAILRALNTLDAKYLLAGTVKRGDWQKVKQYAPIAQWKDWGYFDINTGRQMKDVLFDSDTRLERLRQAGMAGASAADSFTWARLWNAVEAETKDRRKDLKPGTKEFYQAVGQRFSEIVDQTQVVDGVLQRSHIMRSPDGLTKMTTSFMGEPTKSYNMFLNAVYDLRHATGKESRRTARRALVRTSVALAVSFTINAVMQSLVDGLRDDDKELDYWERVQRAFIGFSGDEESFLDYWNSFWSGNLEASYNPLSYMPYFKDLVSIIQGYDVSRMDAEALEKVFTSGKNFWQALNGEGRYSLAGASASFLAELSRLFGLPVANLKRDIQGTVTSAAIETDDYWLQYQIDKALLNIGYSGNRSGFMDILYAASVNDPEAYELIYDDMTASGITQEQIRTSMETRMREAQGVESVADLTRRYLTPDQERTYNRIYSQVTSSAIWSAASEEQREAVEDDLYDLAAGTDAGQRLQEKINGGASYGISDGDYLLYLAAREIADAANEDPEKRNGSIDQSEAEAAIDMLTGLSNEARAYLWQSTNKGWSEKNNPYR